MSAPSPAQSLLSLDETLGAVNGALVSGTADAAKASFHFTAVATDSRQVANDTLFVPLIGENQDGHKYVPQALEQGASVVFICRKNYEADSRTYDALSRKHPEAALVTVNDTLSALQCAAAKYGEKFP